MGVRQRRIAQAEIRLRPIDRFRGLLRLSRAFVRTPREMQRLDRDFQAFRSRYDGMQLQAMNRPELAEVYGQMKAELLSRWDVTLLNDIHAFIFTALLKKVQRDGSPGGQAQLNKLGEVESLKPVSLLRRIAQVAPKEVLALDTSESVRVYLQRDEPFSEILRDYLADYGDRYLEELKLESKTFRTDPELLVEMLRRLKDPDKSQVHSGDPGKEKDQGKGNDIKKDKETDKDKEEDMDWGKPIMGGGVQVRQPSLGQASRRTAEWGLSGMIYRRAANAIRQREISRLNRTRIFGMARAIFLGLGRELASSGELAEAQDVFWLTQAEAFSGGDGRKAIVLGRKAMYQAFARLPMLSRLEFAGDVFDRTLPGNVTAQGSDGGSLIADGASPGIARGQILLVADPRLAADFAGRILVTRQTDPGWVFLITQAAGIIAEKGSLLSHTAIIARELGKPVVVGLSGALGRFRDGEWVEINGSTGEIRRLDQ